MTIDNGSMMMDNIDFSRRNTSQIVKYVQDECTTTIEELGT